MQKRRSCLPSFFLILVLLALGLLGVLTLVPAAAAQTFGPPDPRLGPWQRFDVAVELLIRPTDLTAPRDPGGGEQLFTVESGESVFSISQRLEGAGLIPSARALRAYLVWSGLDTYVQTGTYRLSPAMPASEIARTLASAGLTEVVFTVLPGWRVEEIAAALPTSGLAISPEAFLAAASQPLNPPAFLPPLASAEGFLAPGEYLLPRTTDAQGLVAQLLERFSGELTPNLEAGFAARGLTVYQAVTLASIVEREAVVADEMPLIASVFYNRLAIGMILQSDPTVQYALGYNAARGAWWTTPLSGSDLRFDSPFNTYLYPGLPPTPIANPGLAALTAAAYPAQSTYYFFQARCDGSGLHNFAETYEQHRQNNCH